MASILSINLKDILCFYLAYCSITYLNVTMLLMKTYNILESKNRSVEMYYYDYFRSQYNDELGEPESLPEFYCPYLQFLTAQQTCPMCMSRQQGNSSPPGPPPTFTPSKESNQLKSGGQVKAVDPGSIKHCLFKYVYIWPKRGNGFWAWLTHVGRKSISGFRWYRGRWAYFGLDLNQIDSFLCY